MKSLFSFFVLACFLPLTVHARREFSEKDVVGRPGSRLVYHFLSKLKIDHSMVSSRELLAYITEDKAAFDKRTFEQRMSKDAWVVTLTVKEIIDISESIEGDIVTAIVRSTEHEIEFLCFRILNNGVDAKLVPSKLRNESSPQFDPWLTRQFYK